MITEVFFNHICRICPQTRRIYRFMPTAYVLYNAAVVKEDRAPLGSDPSALAMPHDIGRHLHPVPSFIKYAGGSNAINPCCMAAVSTNFSGVDLINRYV